MATTLYVPKHIRWHPRVVLSRFKMSIPFVIWLGAIAAAVFLYHHGGRFGGTTGVVDTVRVQVSPLEDSRLQAILVSIGQDVRMGDPLAVMDTTLLDAELVSERLQVERQFAGEVADLTVDLQDARLRFAEARGELDVLATEVDRLEELLEQRMIDRQTVSRLRARRGALEEMVKAYPQMIAEIEQALGHAMVRKESAWRWVGSPQEGAPEAQAGWLNRRRDAYTLRASMDGTVSSIDHEVGEMIPAGEGILSIVSGEGLRIIGFLPEVYAREAEVGMQAYLLRSAGESILIPARVEGIAPDVFDLPLMMNPMPNRVLRGRRIVLVPETGYDLLPGERVEIQFHRPWLTIIWQGLRDALGRLVTVKD
ncbi:MAG: HlyD family efflux transporter periplasmic adaptor subunit [Kiritimatiellae bacterium]|nr:HlyD family efflux transporter periplasmic adaptor subunit [Kiritimatiellia bacterium]